MIQRLRYQTKVTVHTRVYIYLIYYTIKNACLEPLASKPRLARSLLAVKEIQSQRKNIKVVPLTIGPRDVGTLRTRQKQETVALSESRLAEVGEISWCWLHILLQWTHEREDA